MQIPEKRAQIIEYAKLNPTSTLRDIARETGSAYSYTSKVLRESGITPPRLENPYQTEPTRTYAEELANAKPFPAHCPKCGVGRSNFLKQKLAYSCLPCGTYFQVVA